MARSRHAAHRSSEGKALNTEATGSANVVTHERRGVLWQLLGILAEILITCAAICALYIVWQMWWTGVEAEQTQNETMQSVSWSEPGQDGEQVSVAQAQEGDPPVQPESPQYGDLIAQVYIPRFGENWHRNLVEGTTLEQLNRHGLGHYSTSQLPGQVGNFAIAGHRNGYGQPLGDVDKLQVGDAIIIRTQDYWYVYSYASYEIVLPTDVYVIGANPENPGAEATKRMITLTTCEPKYSTPTHRWISYGELKYWAKVSDGVPAELATTDSSGTVTFAVKQTPSVASRIGSLDKVVAWALVAWAIVFIAAAVAWRWPALRAIREGRRRRPDASIYGTLQRLQPGVLPIRCLLLLLLLFAAAAALFQWGFPWAAANIPLLQQMSNFVAVE
ncbi:class E sortase [Bifidobacterium oedipodis]|uniref:Sortase family protein n=1 Tax=Bifidobacterium oedipodis TaxID=2675322 RepID=A0A7Y0ERP2_9BIFI|nr:class E sortase [Bifidobacterium sp. DSM 109957]NMM94723.1 Sortase family protein [Bifidobacterium sp. DSM 109957]